MLKVIDTETLQVVGDVMPDGSGSYVTVNNSSVSTWRPEHDPAETVDTPEELLGDRILNRTPYEHADTRALLFFFGVDHHLG